MLRPPQGFFRKSLVRKSLAPTTSACGGLRPADMVCRRQKSAQHAHKRRAPTPIGRKRRGGRRCGQISPRFVRSDGNGEREYACLLGVETCPVFTKAVRLSVQVAQKYTAPSSHASTPVCTFASTAIKLAGSELSPARQANAHSEVACRFIWAYHSQVVAKRTAETGTCLGLAVRTRQWRRIGRRLHSLVFRSPSDDSTAVILPTAPRASQAAFSDSGTLGP